MQQVKDLRIILNVLNCPVHKPEIKRGKKKGRIRSAARSSEISVHQKRFAVRKLASRIFGFRLEC